MNKDLDEYLELIRQIVQYRYPGFTRQIDKHVSTLLEGQELHTLIDKIVDSLMSNFKVDTRDLDNVDLEYDLEEDELPIPSRNELQQWIEATWSMWRDIESKEPKEVYKLYLPVLEKKRKARKTHFALRDTFRFFNRPHANAEFEHWLSMPIWTIDETVSLSLGKDPSVVTWAKVRAAGPGPFNRIYSIRMEILERAISRGDLTEKISPESFIEWALQHRDFDIPDELRYAFDDIKDWKAEYEIISKENVQLHEKISKMEEILKSPDQSKFRINTLYKIILGISVERFKFHTIKNNSASSKIEKLLEDTQFSVSSDTIRNILVDAANKLGYASPEDRQK